MYSDTGYGEIIEFAKSWEREASKLPGVANKLRRARFGGRALKEDTGAASGKLQLEGDKPLGGYDPTSYERLGGTHTNRPPGATTRANRNKAGTPHSIRTDLHFRAVHKPGFQSTNPRHGHYYDIDPGWRGSTP